MKLRIALLQLMPGQNQSEQQSIGMSACRTAKALGADIALFPEMWSSGYNIPQDAAVLERLAVAADSAFVQAFRSLAAELRMAIGITFLETHAPRPLNSMMLFDHRGQAVLHYAKVHTCDFDDEKMLSSGQSFPVADLDTGRGTVRIGSMICFDREFPESARILMLQGAEVILSPNACPMEINRLAALRTRAYENKAAIATCNYPSGHPDCNGRSTVFDGIAWLQNRQGSRDMCVLDAPEAESIYLAEIDLNKLREYRAGEVMGGKYRHPEAYGILCEDRQMQGCSLTAAVSTQEGRG